MKKVITEDEARELLKKHIKSEGLTHKAFAVKIAKDEKHVTKVLNGQRTVSEDFLKIIGYKKEERIVKKEQW